MKVQKNALESLTKILDYLTASEQANFEEFLLNGGEADKHIMSDVNCVNLLKVSIGKSIAEDEYTVDYKEVKE